MKFCASAVLILLFSGCNLINPPEKVPSYIQIDGYDFSTEGKGSNTNRITELWVDAGDNNEFIGAFEVGSRIPILKSGETKLKIRAGVYVNGMRNARVSYVFYKPYEITVNLSPKEVVYVRPYFTYGANTQFPFEFYEDFEDFVSDFDSTQFSARSLVITSADSIKSSINGLNYGIFTFTKNRSENMQIYGREIKELPCCGAAIFAEFDYRSNTSFTVGLRDEAGNNYTDLILRPNSQWTKVYAQLTDMRRSNISKYRLYFGATHNSSEDAMYIAIDNVKLISIAR